MARRMLSYEMSPERHPECSSHRTGSGVKVRSYFSRSQQNWATRWSGEEWSHVMNGAIESLTAALPISTGFQNSVNAATTKSTIHAVFQALSASVIHSNP